jgi:pyruvyltransferase
MSRHNDGQTQRPILMQPLKLHWSHSKPNFGDWLSPAICEYLSGRRVVHARLEQADLVAVGSLLQRIKPRFWPLRQQSLQIWGSGFIGPQQPIKVRHQVCALRGPLSAELILSSGTEVFGDPGLLVREIYGDAGSVGSTTLGIVPHYRDQADPFVKALHDSVRDSAVIDVFDSPATVVEQIRRCSVVLSSSLHGLIVADAYGIPNAWLQLADRQRGAGFKYRDYYANFGIDNPLPFCPGPAPPALADIVDHIGEYQRPGLEMIKQRLAASFPSELH